MPPERTGSPKSPADIDAEIVLNIQGDEPLVEGDMLDALVEALQDPGETRWRR